MLATSMHADLAWLALSRHGRVPHYHVLPACVMSIETGLCSHTRALRGALDVSVDTKCSYYSEYFPLSFPPGKPDRLLFADVGTATIATMVLSLHSGRVKDSA